MRSSFLKRFSLKVIHEEENQRFLVQLSPEPVTLHYEVEGNTWLITAVNIPPSARELHVGPRLMEYALEKALFDKVTVRPLCAYARNYLARNPRFQTLLSKEESTLLQ
jgi:predicted GNAT family acetyltransferase